MLLKTMVDKRDLIDALDNASLNSKAPFSTLLWTWEDAARLEMIADYIRREKTKLLEDKK